MAVAKGHLDLTGSPTLVSLAANDLVVGTTGSADFIVVTNGTERLRIASDGTTTLSASVDFTLANNDYLLATDAAGTGTLSLLKADSSDNTVLNAKTAKNLQLAVNGTALLTLSSGAMTFSNTTFGITGTTSDGSDNQTISICAGGALSAGRGASIQLWGNEHANKGDAEINTGDASGSDIRFYLNASNGNFNILDGSNHQLWGFDVATASLTSNATYGGNLVFGKGNTGVCENIGTLAGAGSTQSDAAAIATTVCRVTGADGTVGVKLPALSTVPVGFCFTIINSDTTNALMVYSDAAGETISGQSGTTAISVAAKLFLRVFKYDSSNWYAEKGVAAY